VTLPNLLPFGAGATAMAFFLVGLFFLRFWTRSRDRLFLAFAGAFWLLTLQTCTALIEIPDEPQSWTYLFRVAAYLLIIIAVLVKNRRHPNPW
jgi:peptidoglycan/LPS O-acetylase OafA/YrhL